MEPAQEEMSFMDNRKPQFTSGGVRHATINGHRFHLRVLDPTNDNFLWLDGQSPPLILDNTAADFVAHLIDAMWLYQQGEGDESPAVVGYVVDKMYKKYGGHLTLFNKQVTRRRIEADLHRIFGTLTAIAEGKCPVDVTEGPKEIDYAKMVAPARMDLAITYRCNLTCSKCYVGNRKVGPEMKTGEWIRILEILWRVGVPQVIFTGGEPTLREDLITLISEAEEFVTGLITNGTTLAGIAKDLKSASLDYVQITFESHDAKVHDNMTGTEGSHTLTLAGLEAALSEGIQVTTNTTLTKANAGEFPTTLEFLSRHGVRHAACNTLICSGRGINCKDETGLTDTQLSEILVKACQVAEREGMTLQWYSPTCYTLGLNPIELGFGSKACSAAAYNMTIEPDGGVLPCQSWPDTVGNILKDNWEKIWQHPTCIALRAHTDKKEECAGCTFDESCAGGCPLDLTPRKRTP
jgi:radical SAM protein with 4Fe4S-binding SPASM domain